MRREFAHKPPQKSPLADTELFLSEIGFGTAPLGNRFKAVTEQTSQDLLSLSSQLGINFIDTAPMYGQGLAEQRVANFLRRVDRSEIVLSTKVGRRLVPQNESSVSLPDHVDPLPFEIVFDYSYQGTIRSIEDSLQRLGTNYIDIALIHDCDYYTHGTRQAIAFAEAINGALNALSDLKRSGLVKAIGLGVNEWQVCDRLLDLAQVDCFLIARELSLLGSRSIEPFLERCVERNVSLIIGGVFHGGLLATGGDSRRFLQARAGGQSKQSQALAIQKICNEFEVPLANVALQFVQRHPAVACAVLGASSEAQLEQCVLSAQSVIPVDLWQRLRDKKLVDISVDHMFAS
ncbi:Pyridoxal 4-dehydrogenase [Roseibium album]|nr:Pyridoxal 4-dehydrogenase [Roseibium album]